MNLISNCSDALPHISALLPCSCNFWDQWEKAYDLARQHQQHVDTVLLYRHKYLVSHGAEETLPKLATAAQQLDQLNEEQIRATARYRTA